MQAAAAVAAASVSGPKVVTALELWRWANHNPAIHLVSRRLPALAPAYPHGLVLHDAVLARSYFRGRSEEDIFSENTVLTRRLRRGLSFVEPAGGGEVVLARRGLPKFFDLDIEGLDDSLQTVGHSPSGKDTGGVLAQRLCEAVAAGRKICMMKLSKANGENAQVSFFAPTHQWVLCSKNVTLLASTRADMQLPHWADHRYRFARVIGEHWFDQLGNIEESHQRLLEGAMSKQTLVGELIGGASHLIDYKGERTLLWFALVPHGGDCTCLPPSETSVFLQQYGLPTVPMEWVGTPTGHTSLHEVMHALRGLAGAIDKARISDEGEGCVVYFVAKGIHQLDETIGLGKLKTAEYRLLRKLREKAKHFARSAGSMLIDNVVASYCAEVSSRHGVDPTRAEEHAATLAKVCRYIYNRDIPADTVDEHFLDVLAEAKAFSGGDMPRPAAAVICLLTPPFVLGAELVEWFDGALAAACKVDRSDLRRMLSIGTWRGGAASAWHLSSAGQLLLQVDHVPYSLERALLPHSAVPALPAARKRRRAAVPGDRHLQTAGRIAEELRERRCLFVLWGWSPEGCARSLELAAEALPAAAPRDVEGFLRHAGKREAMLEKWQSHAERLRRRLPSARTLWLPAAPKLGGSQALSTLASSLEATLAAAETDAEDSVITVVLPVGLPGMGKSSLLEHLFQRLGRTARCTFRQGKFEKPPGVASSQGGCELQASEDQPCPVAAVSLLSSDGFTASELRARGLAATQCSSSDVLLCRRHASKRYSSEVERFLKFAGEDASSMHMQQGAHGTEKLRAHYVLLLDKNYPPAALHREAEVLSYAVPGNCRLQVKALVLGPQDEPPAVEVLEQEESREYGPWQYPWSPETLMECAARLLLRSSHETLVGGDTALFVLLSFLQLHRGHLRASVPAGIEVVHAPYVSLRADLASWRDLHGDESEATWRRFEVRRLLREALRVLQPFGDPVPAEPLLAALRKCFTAAGLRVAAEAAQFSNVEHCTKIVLPALLERSPSSALPPIPPVRYIALSVERHHAALQAAFARATSAMCNEEVDLGGPFPSPLYESPALLHVTTLFLGGAVPSDGQRQLLAASRRLFRSAASFDCTVTHIVCARGALACAAIDRDHLVASGAPLDGTWPHITLCTRPPWQPKHSNAVLEALAEQPGGAHDFGTAGQWWRAVRVGGAVLDIFVWRLAEPLVLSENRLLLF